MSSTKIQKIIEKTAKENKELFDSLIEFEKNRQGKNKNKNELHNKQGFL